MSEPATQTYPKEPVHNLTYNEALERINSGWKGARQQWHDDARHQYVLCTLGTMVTFYDRTTGFVDGFLIVRKPDGKYAPWVPTEDDIIALDWAVLP